MRSLLFFCLIFLCGCMSTVTRVSNPVKVIHSDEMTWIVESVMAKWRHEEGRRLKLEHSSLYYNTTISSLRLEISSQEILEIDAARDLLVDFVEDMLREINSNPIVSNELISYPFTPNQLHVEINFESFHGIYVDPFYVGCICLHNGMARYNAFDMKDEDWYTWHSRVEPYTKSREISTLSRAANKRELEKRKEACMPRLMDEYMLHLDPFCGERGMNLEY